MSESIIDRIEQLERSNRRWKTVSLILAALLLSVLTTGVAFLAFAQQQAAMRQELRAREAAEAAKREAVMRQEAEAARIQAERALQEAKERKKD
jgi:uncharacterized protein HemX